MRTVLSRLVSSFFVFLMLISLCGFTILDQVYQYNLTVESMQGDPQRFDLMIISGNDDYTSDNIVLKNQRTPFQVTLAQGKHQIKITALDEDVVVRSKIQGESNGRPTTTVAGEYNTTIYQISSDGKVMMNGGS